MLMTKRKPATVGEILIEEFMEPLARISHTPCALRRILASRMRAKAAQGAGGRAENDETENYVYAIALSIDP